MKYDCKQDMLGATRCSKQCDECRDTFIKEPSPISQEEIEKLAKELVVKFINSFGDYPVDYSGMWYNESKGHGINLISYLEDFAEGILENKCAELNAGKESDAINFLNWVWINNYTDDNHAYELYDLYIQSLKPKK